MNYAQDFGYETNSKRGLLYYLIFPLDAFAKNKEDPAVVSFSEQKQAEIWPIFIFLIPLIVLLAGFTLHLGLFSALLFFGLESLLLAGVCKFYIQIDDLADIFNLLLNFWISFMGISVLLIFLLSFLSIFF